MTNNTVNLIKKGKRKRQLHWIVVTSLLTILSLALCCAMLFLGNTIYSVSDIIQVFSGEPVQGATFAVMTIRLPRMLAGLLAGFAFGIGGHIFQTLLRNPLANPNVIGITTGSSAAAVFCIVILHTSGAVVSTVSVIAALATVLLIYFLSSGKSFSIGRLILVGIGIQAILNAFISYILLIGAQQDLPAAFRWLSGSLNGIQLDELPLLTISVLLFSPVIIILSKRLTSLELGEQMATSLGVPTDRTRIILIVSSVCMIALATAVTGPIAFVSFLAGPIAKRLVGTGFSAIFPAGLVGIVLVLAGDLIGQFAFTVRYPVGIITGIIGAPYLIYLLVRMNKKGEL